MHRIKIIPSLALSLVLFLVPAHQAFAAGGEEVQLAAILLQLQQTYTTLTDHLEEAKEAGEVMSDLNASVNNLYNDTFGVIGEIRALQQQYGALPGELNSWAAGLERQIGCYGSNIDEWKDKDTLTDTRLLSKKGGKNKGTKYIISSSKNNKEVDGRVGLYETEQKIAIYNDSRSNDHGDTNLSTTRECYIRQPIYSGSRALDILTEVKASSGQAADVATGDMVDLGQNLSSAANAADSSAAKQDVLISYLAANQEALRQILAQLAIANKLRANKTEQEYADSGIIKGNDILIKVIQAVSVLGKLVETHCTSKHIAAIHKSKNSKDMLIRIDPNKHKLGFGGYSLSQDQMCHRAALRAIRSSYAVCDNYPDECAAINNNEKVEANTSKIIVWRGIYSILKKRGT